MVIVIGYVNLSAQILFKTPNVYPNTCVYLMLFETNRQYIRLY
jgi:hypothetical protein